MRNCVFFNNRNTQGNLDMLSIDPLAVFASLGGNITDETTTELNHPSDQTNIDPLLGPLGTNGGHTKTHALDPASPAIDAGFGSGAVLPSNDQRGFDRVIDGDTDGTATIDSGAYEFVGNLTVTTEIDEVLDPGVGLSLREALTQIGDGGIITISFALNGETTNLVGPSAQSTPLLIDKNITIDASRLGDGFSISGLSQINVMEIDNASVTLQGITLKRGTLSGNGGAGLRVTNDADVTMIDGGVQASESDGNGGGIHIDGSSSLDLLRTNINNNATTLSTGRPGGGIFVGPGGDLSIRNSTVSNNFATSSGGGIHASANSQVTITRSSIIQNECDLDHGGGLYLSLQSNITAENMTLSGNVSNNIGGGIYGANISGSITHSTIADNRSMTNGGGIHLLNGSTLDIGHTILAANTNNSGLRNVDVPLGAITSLGFNLIDGNPSFADPLHDYTKRKPFLAPLALYGGENRTHALLAISPAIDAGDAGITQAPSTDARGFVRIATGKGNPAAFPRIDIGAVEAGNFISVATAVDEFNNTGQVSLREALAQINDGERILFGPALNGATIDISSAGGGQNNPLTIDKTVQIDATTLPDGMEISGGNSRRVLSILAENTVALHALTIRDGSSVGDGAGIRSLADLVITHSCIRDNSSNGDGGGIAAEEGSLRLFNSTVSGNSSGANGGAIALTGSASATFDACTIASNSTSSATLTGGLSLGTANATTYSSIFANNTNSAGSNNFDSSSTLTDHLTSRGFNIADDGGARVFIETGDLQSTNPLLGALNSNNGWSDAHAPGIASPAIDAGDSFLSLVQCYDQRGFTRVAGAAPDIGAFERDGQVDSDSDGMPDYWEDLYGFDSSNPGDAALDANQNGITNLSEFLNGDDPLLFLIVDLAPVGIIAFSRDSANNSMDLTLSTDPGSSYSVLHSTDLRQWSTLFIQTGHLGTNQTAITIDLGLYGIEEPRGYFRTQRY
ncbi:MAG: choice-of-anchor Q domain-containing protein [Verrucomicrobiota bacterium]